MTTDREEQARQIADLRVRLASAEDVIAASSALRKSVDYALAISLLGVALTGQERLEGMHARANYDAALAAHRRAAR